MDNDPYIRPATPQALLHRLPDKPSTPNTTTKPTKYIILLLAPTSVAGKVQIATSVATSLCCPLFQGDSLHESSAKAASVGADRSGDGGRARYQRMWMRKMTRTGLLFPEESRPANEGFSGFGGGSDSAATSRRGSGSSVSSSMSFDAGEFAPGAGSVGQFVNKPVFALSEEERLRKSNPALMVLTHPELEAWHKVAIRESVGEYGIGVIYVPLTSTDAENDDEGEINEAEELPVLRPLDPSAVSGFTSFDALRAAVVGDASAKKLKYGQGKQGTLREEMLLRVNVEGDVEEIIEAIVSGVKDVMSA